MRCEEATSRSREPYFNMAERDDEVGDEEVDDHVCSCHGQPTDR